MSKITYLETLYLEAISKVTSDETKWKDLLKTVGRYYKRSFDNAVLIHTQAPNSTQIATFDEWHSDGINRSIKKGAKGLAVIDMSNPKASFKHYFDLLDTNGTAESFKKVVSYMWELEDQYKPSIMVNFHTKYGISMESMEDCIYEMVEKTVSQRLGTFIENFKVEDERNVLYDAPTDAVKQALRDTIISSVYYTVATRCGINAEHENFENIAHFNTLAMFTTLGYCIINIARPVLREINNEINDIKMERSKVYENRTISEANLYRGNGRTVVSEPENFRERADRGRGQIREDVERVDDGVPPTESIRADDDGQNQPSDRQSGRGDGTTQRAVDSEYTHNTTYAKQTGHFGENLPHGNDLSPSRGTNNQRRTIQSEINTDKPFVESHKKLPTDGFFVPPKSKNEIEQQPVQLEEQEELKPVDLLPVGTFFDYLNSIFIYTDTDKEDIHILRSLEEKNVAFSFTTEGFLELMLNGQAVNITDPDIQSVFGYEADDEIYIWSTKYKILDFDCDEVVFENVNNAEDIRNHTLLDTLAYIDNAKNQLLEESNLQENRLSEKLPRDTRFALDNKEISDLIDVFIMANDIDGGKLEVQSEIHSFFIDPHNKFSAKIRVVKAYYKTLDTSYVTETGDYIEVIKSAETGIHFERNGQKFYVSYLNMAERIDRLILMGVYPFSSEDLSIDDYSIPDEIHEMQGVIDEVETIEPVNETMQFEVSSLNHQNESYEDIEPDTNDNLITGDELIKEVVLEISVTKPYFNQSDISNYDTRNYQYSPSHNLYEGGVKTKCKANIEAIKLLKVLENENREATKDEQIILAGYVSWGGLANALTENKQGFENEYAEIKALLTEEEFKSAEESTLTAYFTEQTVVRTMYEALEQFGFKGGSILDPAMGTGNFFSVLPHSMQNSALYGVELDSITGRIAKKLYPTANIEVMGYEHTRYADNSFDVAIGNIPFNNININDSRYNKHNFKIHDYFIAKTLDKVRSGGIIAFITSKFTMDKVSQNVRKYIAQRAELLGAIRLPNAAFKKVAGTKATTDIIFLKKRDVDIVSTNENSPWLTIENNEDGVPVNSYFIDHPEMVLGKMVFDKSMYGDETDTACHPVEGEVLEERLKRAIRYLDCKYEEPVSEYEGEKEHTGKSRDSKSGEKNFSYNIYNNKVWYRENSKSYLQEIGGKKEERIRGMVEIHSCVKDLIDFQTDDYVKDNLGVYKYNQAIQEKIGNLNECYDKFVKKYGYINQSANVTAFKKDGASALIRSIECKDSNDKTKYIKSDMFKKPTIFKKEVEKAAFNAQDALIMNLNAKGKVDIEYMAYIYVKPESEIGKATKEEILEELGDKIYRDPDKIDRSDEYSGYVLADEYLSGYVKDKLVAAEFMAGKDESYKRNVEALKEVQPIPLEPHQISFDLSSTWIPKDVYEQFIYELCGTKKYNQGSGGIELEFSEYMGNYHITAKAIERGSVKATETYGTGRKNAYEIIEDTLNLRNVKVTDPKMIIDSRSGEEKKIYVLNKNETILARAKQEEIKLYFKNWLFSDSKRNERLTDLYNDKFNNIVVRKYNGDNLIFPDMSDTIKLRKHQRDVIAHGLFGNGNLLMAHEVGAGKTYSAIALGYEMKRMGIVNKPLITVPNHLVNQWAAEYMKLYPNANILVAEKRDLQKENRKRFCSRIAASEYDAIIMAHSSFELIGLSREYQLEAMEKEIEQIVNAISDMKCQSGSNWSLKQMEIFKKNLQYRYDILFNAEKKDNVINFEQLGVDCLVTDESHTYKNNFSYTKLRNVAGVGKSSSQRAMDMHQKAQYINKINNGKGVIDLTGTPISNSMSELFVIQKKLQPNELVKRKHLMFDSWASHFGVIKNSLEIKPEGGAYQMKSRFAEFHNLPELMTLFRLIADIKTAEDLDEVPVPKLRTDGIQVIKSKITPTQKDIVMELVERAEDIRDKKVDREEDNFLKLTMEAKLLSVDPRILDDTLPDDPDYKLNICARKTAEIYHQTAEDKLTQLIFCDSVTPKNDVSFNFYSQTKKVLISEGVKAEEIAFIHDYETDLQKEQLFEKMRAGEIIILMGSTQKMGTGMNIQDRLIALHNLDIPWKPSDLIQRIGRIVRQGNLNHEVEVINYITEDTFDSYLYQILEQKQRYITQIMKGDSTLRKCEDMDETVLQYAEFKALVISDPNLKEKMEVENELSRLMILKSAHHNAQSGLKAKVDNYYPNEIESKKQSVEKLTKDISTLKEKKSIEFMMEIDGHIYTERPRAAEHFSVIKKRLGFSTGDTIKIGDYAGFGVSLMRTLDYDVTLVLKGAKEYYTELGQSELGAITRLENTVDRIPKLLIKTEKELEDLQIQLEQAKVELLKPFSEENRINELHKRKVELDLALEFKQGGDDTLSDDEDVANDNLAQESDTSSRRNQEQKLFDLIIEKLAPFIQGESCYAKYKSEGFDDLVIENMGGGEYSIAQYHQLIRRVNSFSRCDIYYYRKRRTRAYLISI